MENLVQHIIRFIGKEKELSKDEYDIYKYGLLSGLEMTIWILVSMLTAVCMNLVKEALIFMAIFITTRSYVGGIHLKKYGNCFTVSYLVYMIVLLLSKCTIIDGKSTIVLGIIVIAVIGYLCLLDNRFCNCLEPEMRESNKGAYIVLSFWGIASVIAYFISSKTIQNICVYTFTAIMISKLVEVSNKAKLIWKKRRKR